MAPVVEADADKRRFYLPDDLWYDYWTGERVTGGREIERPCPIDKLSGLPIIMRSGTILPLQEQTSFLDQAVPERLRLVIYPDTAGCASLCLDEAEMDKLPVPWKCLEALTNFTYTFLAFWLVYQL